LLGETGTGRRHLARWLHDNGPDAEGELTVAQPGRDLPRVDPSAPGTLLLPRVDNWSTEAQVRLLRQLELLAAEDAPRIIATASPELDQSGDAGALLPELYFRLAVLVVGLVPLRDRPGDLAPLLTHFLTQHSRHLGQPRPAPSPEQVARLAAHRWPGNLRELANLAERALVLGPSAFDIAPSLSKGPPATSLVEGFSLSTHMETVERSMLERAIEQTRGDRTAMARLLGLERNTLRYKLNKYDLLKRT
jgi:DNA-binding NtrC family response regulator